jgi:hypothetical protein
LGDGETDRDNVDIDPAALINHPFTGSLLFFMFEYASVLKKENFYGKQTFVRGR